MVAVVAKPDRATGGYARAAHGIRHAEGDVPLSFPLQQSHPRRGLPRNEATLRQQRGQRTRDLK